MKTFVIKRLVGKLGIATVFLLLLLIGLHQLAKFNIIPASVSRFTIVQTGQRSVQDITEHYSATVEERLKPWFKKAGVTYPPQAISMLAFKKEQKMELWALHDSNWTLIKKYPFTANSGVLGPKLREGDKQIPEGIYQISAYNPNSSYHLSMKLNYPNKFDLQHAKSEGRKTPGTNIFIHGSNASVGCIALGNVAIEELFVISALSAQSKIVVVVAPWDFRSKSPDVSVIAKKVRKPWLAELYKSIDEHLESFPLPNKS